MRIINDGGQAFPSPESENYGPTKGMSFRDYLAANCPDSWLDKAKPRTMGDVRDAMIERKIIPKSRKDAEVAKAYNKQEELKLDCALRYEYADMMIEARE